MQSLWERFEKSLTVSMLWVYILRLLQEKESHGYEMHKRLVEKFGFGNKVTTYVTLYKMRSEGLVQFNLTEFGDRRTKQYEITEKGERSLKAVMGFLDITRNSISEGESHHRSWHSRTTH